MQDNARRIILRRLKDEIDLSRTADLQRAVEFLKAAREVRRGKIEQRSKSRESYSTSRIRKADQPMSW
tara:strand:+ start:432 stop:635 length:204 start_codon:yes stop_codon:yes gene_type:complete